MQLNTTDKLIYENDELAHHGVKGMKWGVRKDRYITNHQANKNRKKAYKEAYIDSTKKSGGRVVSGYGVTAAIHPNLKSKYNAKAAGRAAGKQSLKNDLEYNKQVKAARKQRRVDINKVYEKIHKSESFRDKLLYNNATRRAAAKYVVDHNMSMTDARKKANKEALRNTGILLAACGGMMVTSAVAIKNA